MTQTPHITINNISENSLQIKITGPISETNTRLLCNLFQQLKRDKTNAIVEGIPAYNTLLIVYDLRYTDHMILHQNIKKQMGSLSAAPLPKKTIKTLPVYYGKDVAWDLEHVAKYNNISIEAVISLHTKAIYSVFAMGFAPGFPYLGPVPTQIHCPRMDSPRMKVPAGAVAIAHNQTGIYPKTSPGGWNIIGLTPMILWNENNKCVLSVGDSVQFERISRQQFLNQGGVLEPIVNK